MDASEVKIVIVKQFDKNKTTREVIGSFFSECGAITSLAIVKDQHDANLGIAIISFQILSGASFAAQLSGSILNDRAITVRVAPPTFVCPPLNPDDAPIPAPHLKEEEKTFEHTCKRLIAKGFILPEEIMKKYPQSEESSNTNTSNFTPDDKSSSEEPKKPEGPVYIENGAFVPLPKNKDGTFRPLPKAVKTRENNLIEKLKEIKAAAHIEDVEVRSLLNEFLVAIVNNNRLSFSEYHASVQGVIQKDHEDMLNLKEQANQKFEQLKEEYEQRERDLNEEHKKALAEETKMFNELKERKRLQARQMMIIEKKWETDWTILKEFGEKNSDGVQASNIFFDLMEKKKLPLSQVDTSIDFFKKDSRVDGRIRNKVEQKRNERENFVINQSRNY